MWIHREPFVYDYRMTMIAGIIAKGGVVVAADGRSTREVDGSVASDFEKKIFELSPHCALLVTGGIAVNLETRVEDYRSFIAAKFRDKTMRKEQEKAATFIHDIMSPVLSAEKDGWADDPNIVFLIAGYDSNRRRLFARSHTPRLYPIFNDGERYRRESAQPYFASGEGQKLAYKVLHEYKATPSLDEANKMAARAFKEACKTTAVYKGKVIYPVGGRPQLWNIYPNKKTKVFTDAEIEDVLNHL